MEVIARMAIMLAEGRYEFYLDTLWVDHGSCLTIHVPGLFRLPHRTVKQVFNSPDISRGKSAIL